MRHPASPGVTRRHPAALQFKPLACSPNLLRSRAYWLAQLRAPARSLMPHQASRQMAAVQAAAAQVSVEKRGNGMMRFRAWKAFHDARRIIW